MPESSKTSIVTLEGTAFSERGMSGRAWRLYFMGIQGAGHRLRHDLGREVVVFVSSLVLFATFIYVFNDFLNVQVKSLSGPMHDRFAQVADGLCLVLGALGAGRSLRQERTSPHSLRRMAAARGEDPGVLKTYWVLRTATVVTLWHAGAWWAVQRWLLLPPTRILVATELALLLLTATSARSSSQPARAASTSAKVTVQLSVVTALWQWRWELLQRQRLARLVAVAGCLFLALMVLGEARQAPLFVAALAALTTGYLASVALYFQVAEDLPHVWTERSAGVSHDQYMAGYEQLSVRLGLALGVVAFVLRLVALCLFAAHIDPLAALDGSLKVAVLAALPVFFVPWIMLQIDGRRAAVNLLISLLGALFIGTAVLANWLGLLLVPLVRYYARQTQLGRFYRA